MSETVKKIPGFVAVLFAAAASLFCAPALANPQGGQVVDGSASITASGKTLDIHQHSDRAVIDWRRFDIDLDEHTRFHQPSSTATALNRVRGTDPSRILGTLSANGNLILVNPNGVFFGRDARIDVNGLIATTSHITSRDFMAGDLNFTPTDNPEAAIINEAAITAKEAGLVALVAPNVANRGIISAKLGRVELASGDQFTVDLYGDGLYELAISDDIASQIISNTGRISAGGGTISITAAAGREMVNSLITIQGELKAPSIEHREGKIIISAQGSNAVPGNLTDEKGQKQGQSIVLVGNALLDVSGRAEGEQGGQIQITADHIALMENTVLDASGHSSPEPTAPNANGGTASLSADGRVRNEADFLAHENRAGGSIKIGGGYLGGGETPTARSVTVDPGTLILNDAIVSGDGGRTIVWSDETTLFYGTAFGRGGVAGGNGGFLETSGRQYLEARGVADLSAAQGYDKGTYLLDPAAITIYGDVDPAFISTDTSIDLASNQRLWLDAADAATITQNAGSVSQWADKSGSGNHAVQGSGASQPTTGTTSLNGVNTIAFDGADDYMSGAAGLDSDFFSAVISADPAANVTAVIISGQGQPWHESVALGPVTGFLTNEEITYSGNDKILPVKYYRNATTTPIDNGGNILTMRKAALEQEIFLNGSGNLSNLQTTDGVHSQAAYDPWTENDAYTIGGVGASGSFTGGIGELLMYNRVLTDTEKTLLTQYQSAKWGVGVTPPGTGATEAAKAMASDGYSVFTTRYLERLSSTADIILQATNTISLDLKGDTLTLADDRSIALQTANGNISSQSSGSIATNRTGVGGNISFVAGGAGNIAFNHDLSLTAWNGGDITMTAGGGNVTFGGTADITADNLNVIGTLAGPGTAAFSFRQATAGKSLDVGSGGTADVTLPDALVSGIQTAFGSTYFGRSDGGDVFNHTGAWEDPVTFKTGTNFTNAAAMASDDTILVEAGNDVVLDADMATASTSANALVLSAGNDFINNAGTDALSAANSRWLAYSATVGGSSTGGLSAFASEYNKTYAANPPASIGAGNRFVYAGAAPPAPLLAGPPIVTSDSLPNTVMTTSQTGRAKTNNFRFGDFDDEKLGKEFRVARPGKSFGKAFQGLVEFHPDLYDLFGPFLWQ